MKEIFVGTAKAMLFIVMLLTPFGILNGFNTVQDVDIAILLTVGIILFVFIEREEHRKPYSNRCLRKNGWYCLCDFSHNPDTQDPYVKSDRLHSNRKREVASYFDIQEISHVQSSFRIKSVR